MKDKKILKVKNLSVYFKPKEGIGNPFKRDKRVTKAVDNISFDVYENEVLGIVGETGCGKSTIATTIVLINKITKGEIYFKDKLINNFTNRQKLDYFKKVQMIFQDPYSALNPRMTMYELLRRPLRNLTKFTKKEIHERLIEVMKLGGLSYNDRNKFPHEFSGGQRQRICITRALLTRPNLLIADEPTSALDVSIQAKILDLFKDLKLGSMTMIFISHDISVILFITDRVAVMYSGKIIEIINTNKLISESLHPYTKKLIKAVPKGYRDRGDKLMAKEKYVRDSYELKNLNNFESMDGCIYQKKCLYANDICGKKMPDLIEVGKDHLVACHNLHRL